ncbi:MAG: carboxylating nicotinate-nucleotide diphosphorylase [Candidatus Omnitrophica bacterium]|nr:carboxylating nicotinate-nucleotide diphosphorylase [Candidatus Omnitrophota bacterium]
MILPLIRQALREDGASRDLTSRAVLPADTRIRARILAKSPGVLAGGQVAAWVFQALDRSLRSRLAVKDGVLLRRGQTVLTVEGNARSIFAAERTALNLLGHLSGIATLTREYVRRTQRTYAKILDTRKTLPGLRAAEKYAVRAGGGENHRDSLQDAILIKTNHIKALRLVMRSRLARERAIQVGVAGAKRVRPKRFVEVEVTTLREFEAALEAKPHAILLDNWRLGAIRRAVRLAHASLGTRHSPLIEVSGGVTLQNVRAIATTGVDRISIGRLTHSAPSLDMSLVVDR